MRQIYKIISVLLQYPSAELLENWQHLRQTAAGLEDSAEDLTAIDDFISYAEPLQLIQLQVKYVDTFDMNAKNSLYLTHHLFDEQDRDRGPALVELAQLYQATGNTIDGGELPDYLPLILEYVATMDTAAATAFLQQTALSVGIIADNMDKINSPYAPLLKIVARHGQPIGAT